MFLAFHLFKATVYYITGEEGKLSSKQKIIVSLGIVEDRKPC